MNKYDAVIIGFGRGGKSLAAELAGKGWKVAIIERSEEMYGGSCVNVACIPTKAMIHFAALSECRKTLSFTQQSVVYREAVNSVDRLTSSMRKANYEKVVNKENLTLITGEASFRSPHQLIVKTMEGELVIEADKIFINTGSLPIIPSITGIEKSKRVYTSESLLKLQQLPRHLVIIGGGYVGLEFAFMYAAFGSQVTLLDTHPQILPHEDDDIAYYVRKAIEEREIVFHKNVMVQSIRDEKNASIVSYVNLSTENLHELPADAVLIAVGREPDIKSLDLEAAGIHLNDHGAIETDAHLHTSVPGIWAMGDVKGGPMFTYVSLDDYRIIIDELFGKGQRTVFDRDPIPTTLFIEPPLAKIGVGEEEAFRVGCNIKVAKLLASEMGRAKTLGQTEGLMKIVVNADTNHIIGCTFFCVEANEMINLAAVAIHAKLDYRFMRDQVFTHPSMSEAFNKLLSLIE
ncbi:FAD-dependent oxidoreductase [Parabacteroides pacaensis]|uniref:FAD-dependent oxidoreductase n=1 Tax=Parabacteroides pacaensis TaxID=2086575 RepID=UPI000D0EA7FE|nr:FAD-dependent oxidoreductase [Parabacteroides pacaensis]